MSYLWRNRETPSSCFCPCSCAKRQKSPRRSGGLLPAALPWASVHQFLRVQVAVPLLHFHVDMRLFLTFTADRSRLAQFLPGRNGLPLAHSGRNTAQPPDAPLGIGQGNCGAPASVRLQPGDLALHRAGHRLPRFAGVVHPIMGTPIPQRFVIDQLVPAEHR